MKASVLAPANIAFIKYWGARDLARALPVNPSISMTLSSCVSETTVEAREQPGADEILLADAAGLLSPAPESFARRAAAHLETLRRELGFAGSFRVATRNRFPSSAGLASSASGFAALTVAVVRALGRDVSTSRLSTLARLSGSGSAARSVLGGYVEWPREGDDDAPAFPLADAAHWDLRDVIAIVETGEKEVSSLDGHRRAATSPHFERRLEELPRRLDTVRRAIRERDLALLGPTLEEEAVDLHLVAMSSRPPIFYWNPGTLTVLAALRDLRREGLSGWATMDAGANVHVICDPASESAIAVRLRELDGVVDVIRDRVGTGPASTESALF